VRVYGEVYNPLIKKKRLRFSQVIVQILTTTHLVFLDFRSQYEWCHISEILEMRHLPRET
jgi:hypothetical protein